MNDGGPAFPVPPFTLAPGDHGTVSLDNFPKGMSLRDWFAGMAMQALLASTGHDTQSIALLVTATEQDQAVDETLAGRAYDFADAMLAAREKGQSNA